MALIRIQGFSGAAPRISERLLGPNQAKIAENTKLLTGELRAWRSAKDTLTVTPDGAFIETGTAQAGAVSTITLAVAASAVDDFHNNDSIRIVSGTGIGQHRFISDYVGATRVAIVSVPWSVVPNAISVYETYDSANPEYLQTIYLFGKNTATEHWLTFNKDVDIARSPIPGDLLERTYFTGLDQPRVTDNTIVDQSGEWPFPQKSFFLGVPVPTGAPVLTIDAGGVGTVVRDLTYVYTFVNGYGEEGPPSPPKTISAVKSDETVNFNSLDQSPAVDWNLVSWRIYRVAVGATGQDFQFLKEVTINLSVPQSQDTTPHDDTVLAEVLSTTSFDPPPVNLKGIIVLPNGIMLGFLGNQVYISEPFKPHAWPSKFIKSVDFTIVAIGNYGQTAVIATDGTPYRLAGIESSNMTLSQIHVDQPCTSKRGMVSSEVGALYPSADGLMRVGPGISEILTIPYFDQDEWQKLKPRTIHASFHDGRYHGFFDTGLVNGELQGSGFIIDTRERGSFYSTLDFYRYASYQSREDDELFLVRYLNLTAAVDASDIEQWEAGGSKLSYKWRSKSFEVNPAGFTAAKIEADYQAALSQAEIDAINAQRTADIAANDALLTNPEALPGPMNNHAMNGLAMNGDGLGIITLLPGQAETTTFKLYGAVTGESNVILRHTETVSNNKPFRMDGKKRYRKIEIELLGRVNVREVNIATSVGELQKR